MALEDTYNHQVVVAQGEADSLSEMELAVLLIDREDPLGDYESFYETTCAKVQKMLNLSVAERAGRKCSLPGCHTEAIYEITNEEGTIQACQKDLVYLVKGPCAIALIAESE